MARAQSPDEMVLPIKRACIAHNGKLTHLYDYINRMRQANAKVVESPANLDSKKNGSFTRLVSLNGHLFDQFLINKALDVFVHCYGCPPAAIEVKSGAMQCSR